MAEGVPERDGVAVLPQPAQAASTARTVRVASIRIIGCLPVGGLTAVLPARMRRGQVEEDLRLLSWPAAAGSRPATAQRRPAEHGGDRLARAKPAALVFVRLPLLA